MKTSAFIFFFSLFGLHAYAQTGSKLTRAQSFWGIHFDRHSQLNDSHLGKTLTEGMIDSMLKAAKPDFIQVDSKGHPGISSFMTTVGQRANSYDKDPLTIIRKVTDQNNVALYAHYSGVMDRNYVRLNPNQARLDQNGKSDNADVSLWGNYCDMLMIPEIKELASRYHLDGVWIDGDAWAVKPDYQPAAIKDFSEKTGITKVPLSPKDDNYKSLLNFDRQKFISYIKYYTSAIHKTAPNFQIASNWAFGKFMPETIPADIGLDFLSGDLDPENTFNDANWSVRCFAGQGKPFDLMSWSFSKSGAPKPVSQLCQEAAAVISMGSGFLLYCKQNEDLSFNTRDFNTMKEVGNFVNSRRAFCKGVIPVPQIGLFYSTAGWEFQTNNVFQDGGVEGIRGILGALLDAQQPVEVIMSHQMADNMNKYPVIVIPEWAAIEPDLVEKFKDYAKNGGKLLIIGSTPAKIFKDILGVNQDQYSQVSTQSLKFNNRSQTITSQYRKVTSLPNTKVLSQFSSQDNSSSGVAATINQYGKGTVAGIYANLGNSYLQTSSSVIRDLLSGVISQLLVNPIVTVADTTHKVIVVPVSKGGNLLIQLINSNGQHANANFKGNYQIDQINNLKVSVLVNTKPNAIVLQPENLPLKYTMKNGRVNFTVPSLRIHEIIEIKNN